MTTTKYTTPEQSALGKKSAYEAEYNPSLLFPIPRQLNRDKIGVSSPLPFFGFDLWNHYEVSWLNEQGKPMVALAEIIFDCASVAIIESKSLKLYFNSFNNTKIATVDKLQMVIQQDLAASVVSSVIVNIIPLSQFREEKIVRGFSGICLDTLDIACDVYHLQPDFLHTEDTIITETVYSDLLKSNCLVTNQPDWGSVQINYTGKKINHADLLRYIISFRNDNEFSELCIERIFMDILRRCQPSVLTVYGRFTRRGGLDINPLRSTEKMSYLSLNDRFCRQ